MRIGGAFREWDELDFLAAGGMIVLAGSLVALLVPRLRRIEVLFPVGIGAAMMAVAGFGARHSDYGATGGTADDTAAVPLRRPSQTSSFL
jgi:hypothetical protein